MKAKVILRQGRHGALIFIGERNSRLFYATLTNNLTNVNVRKFDVWSLPPRAGKPDSLYDDMFIEPEFTITEDEVEW